MTDATGAYEIARRMRSRLSRVFRYGVATVRCDKDVAADLRGAIAVPKVKHFAAITRPSEVGALLRAIDGYTGHKVTVMAMRLSPHVLLRPGELRRAEWTDIDFDEAIWYIPAERMKMRRPHRVPLSRQVIAMLKELHEHTHWWKYLLPYSASRATRYRRTPSGLRKHRSWRLWKSLSDDACFRSVRIARDHGPFDRREAPQYYPDAAGRETISS